TADTCFSKAPKIDFKEGKQAVFVRTSREGIYDMLPQLLFHHRPAKDSNAFKNVRSMVDEYKARVEEEKEARNFFMVYEIEFYRQRVANAMQERNLAEAVSYSMSDSQIVEYWKLPSFFSNRQKGILFYLLPLFHKIRGSVDYMREVYSLILQIKVDISRSNNLPLLKFDNDKLRLGKITLSLDSVIGDSFHYSFPSFVITIQQLEQEYFYDFLPGERNWKIIEKLNDYFVPVFCETEIHIDKKTVRWTLSEGNKNESRLGYSSVL
ncbi:MAG: type VI secretion system baseplate subunit TssG, partial [Bacteroidota bacterium]